MAWVAITKSGQYARRTVRESGIISWDTTESIAEAHRFKSRKAAIEHAELWPAGWSVKEV